MNLLSKTSKMPCYSNSHYNCGIGEKLKTIPGSVCNACYTDKGCYLFHTKKLQAKTELIKNDLDNYMYELEKQIIEKTSKKNRFFRFHDKGDFISYDHFCRALQLCERLPEINFWIPTKSINFLRQYIKEGNIIPENVTIRISSFMIDKSIKLDKALAMFPIASVYKKNIPEKAFLCVTNDKGNCGTCRACWDKNISEIVYLLH